MEKLEIPERTAEDTKHDVEMLARRAPNLYKEYVDKESILEPSRQIKLSKLDDNSFLDYLMDRRTSEHLNIYPEYANNIMRAFSDEIFKNLNAMTEVKLKDLPALRDEIKGRKLITLSNWDSLYTETEREEDSCSKTGDLEYKVAKAIQVPGPHFFTTFVGGYHGILRFYEEEVAKIAPKDANAYLTGTAWCVSVHGGRGSCPILAGEYRDVKQEDSIYHAMPVKFFNVEVDTSKKYTTKTEDIKNGFMVSVVERKK